MLGERHDELVRTVCGLLLGMLPEGATRIVATGDVDDGYAGTSLNFQYPSGQSGHFSMEDLPPESGDLNEVLIDLRDDMLANGGEPWYGITVSVERDGRFDMNLSYDPPED